MTDEIKKVDENSTSTVPPSKTSQEKDTILAKIKEWVRKQIVHLKSRPTKIPMFFIVVTMLVFLLSMNDFSHTNLGTDIVNGGLLTFWSTLLSILVCVLYMNAYPKRQKTKYPMLIMTFVFLAILVLLDFYYIKALDAQLDRNIFGDSEYLEHFLRARAVSVLHIGLLAFCIILCATLPFYTKLIRKIDTSVKLEKSDSEKMLALEEIQE